MEYVFYLDWADKSKNELIGSRGELMNQALELDISLQRTAVVTKNAFLSFLLETGIKESVFSLAVGVDHTSSEDLKRIHQKISDKIMDVEFPWDMEMEMSSLMKGVSKGSELKDAYLILYPSFGPINGDEVESLTFSSHPGGEVRLGLSSAKELMVALRSIWADMFSPEAIRYRRRKGINDDSIYVSVLVQTISQAKQSGFVLSSLGPDKKEDIGVSAIYGLLPALYEEELTPDIYSVDEESLDIKSREINKQTWRYGISEEGEVIKYRVGESRQENQKIDNDLVIRLSKLMKRLKGQTQGVLRMAWTMTNDEILITELKEMTEDEVDVGSVVNTLPVMEPVKDDSSSGGDVYDTGMFGGWFGGGDDDSDEDELSVEDDTTPSLPMQIVTTPPLVGPALVEEKTVVVSVDLSDVNLNEETLGTKIFLDVLTPEDVKRVERGYYNGAFILTERFFTKSYYGAHPNVMKEKKEAKTYRDDLTHRLIGIAKELKPLPLIVKLSDFGADEYLELKGAKQYEVSDKKFLGFRGAARYLHPFFKQTFKNELLAIRAVKEVGYNNIHIMIPFVRTPEELVSVLDLVEECDMGKDLKVWMMASLPSNLAFIDEFSALVDGILLDFYMMSLILLGLDPSIEKPEALGHVLKDQHHPGLYHHVFQAVRGRSHKDVDIVLYDLKGVKDPDILDMMVPYGVNGLITSAKEILKVYPQMAAAERRYILQKLQSLDD